MNSTETTTEAAVNQAINALTAGDLSTAEDCLAQGIALDPTDSRFQLMSAVLAQAQGRFTEGFDHLWRALAAESGSAMNRSELLRAVLREPEKTPVVDKDFSLDSGERQTADEVHLIRADHRARYAFAARWVRHHLAPARTRTGLDVFCGNGYGSHMVSNLAGVRMVGLDGSAEAVALAERAYGSHRTVLGHALFPFDLNGPLFDFAISFESIEHVDDPEGLLQQMACATDGPFIVSVPTETGLPFAQHGAHFEHHLRHFTREEAVSMLARAGRPVIAAEHGQQVYRIDKGQMSGLLPESEMGLRPFDPSCQFCILVAQPAR